MSILVDQPTEGMTDQLPLPIVQWLSREMRISTSGRTAEWTEIDVYVGLPRPGGDAWLSIDRTSGELIYENTDRGAISYLNDLHKGRNTSATWFWFIDIFSVACIIFALTGLWLLQMHAERRPSTWPLVAAGIGLPALLALFFMH